MAKKFRPSWRLKKSDKSSAPETTGADTDAKIDEGLLPIELEEELPESPTGSSDPPMVPGSQDEQHTSLLRRIKDAEQTLQKLEHQIQKGRATLGELETQLVTEQRAHDELKSANQARIVELENEIAESKKQNQNIRQAVNDSLQEARADLGRLKLEGLNSLFKWIEQYFEVVPFSDVGKVSGPRTITIDDLIEFISITDPNGLYITAAEDQDELVVHLPWISDATTVARTAATLTLAVVAAVAESQPLSSKLPEFKEARDVSTLIELLGGSAMNPESEDENPFTPARYANLATHTLTALSHAEYDDSFVDLDAQLILQGLEQSTTEWMNIVLPQFTGHTNHNQSVLTRSQLDALPFEVVTDWLANGDISADGTNTRYSELISQLSATIDRDWSIHFEQSAISALKYWIDGLRPLISRADDLSVGASLLLDLTLRLGNGSMPAEG